MPTPPPQNLLGPTRLAWIRSCLIAGLLFFGSSPACLAWQTLPVSPADTSSPRAVLQSFIDACNEMHNRIQQDPYYDRTAPTHHPLGMKILDCLDTSALPQFERTEAAGEAATCIKEVLDRIELPPLEEVPDAKALRDQAGPYKWLLPGTRLAIVRMEEGPRSLEYLFSSGSVTRAVEYYRDIRSLPYRSQGPATSPGFYDWYVTAAGHPGVARLVDQLPSWFHSPSFGLARWKWFGLTIATAVLAALLTVLLWLYFKWTQRYYDKNLARYVLVISIPIAAIWFPLAYQGVVHDWLTIRGLPLYCVSFGSNLVAFGLALIVISGATNRLAALIIATPRINPSGLDAQFIRITSRLLSIVGAAVVFLEGGRYLGIPLSTLLASAGIGGLAIALAAQDMLKNLFGTLMLLMDKPFRVGERILFGRYDGVIEEIGLRSTKIRLLTGNLAIVPNDELARSDIENIGRRPFIRRAATLALPSSTPVNKMKRAVEIVRQSLRDHEGMDPSLPPQVYLRDLDESAIGIFIVYWYHPPEYWRFLAFSERINLEIMEQLEEEGIRFSSPGLTVSHLPVESPPEPTGRAEPPLDSNGLPPRTE